MASKKDQLAHRIAHLQLRLAPLVPLPSGVPHPAFPRSLLEYHLLTEEQLDSIAHYYHQSTPSIWTYQYPSSMNWDKDFLAKRRRESSSQGRRASQPQVEWWNQFIGRESEQPIQSPRTESVKYSQLTDSERIAIKRRKVGKFIGLCGTETPDEEIDGRLRAAMERAIERAREELRRAEEWELRVKKMA